MRAGVMRSVRTMKYSPLRRLEQLALAALARGEGGLHQLGGGRADDDLLARRILAAGIDVLEGPDLELELLGGGLHRLGLAQRSARSR